MLLICLSQQTNKPQKQYSELVKRNPPCQATRIECIKTIKQQVQQPLDELQAAASALQKSIDEQAKRLQQSTK